MDKLNFCVADVNPSFLGVRRNESSGVNKTGFISGAPLSENEEPDFHFSNF